MSLLNSLLRDFGDDDRDHLLGLIQKSINADLDAVASGAAPPRNNDIGSKTRRGRRTAAQVAITPA
ncbi:hypothetical protein I6A84_04860 [Frankia sp. CNm7]|uniref:Transposase n=1 Tax=Frankia nepalensis TaxID=1836974 RepID=A0A937UT81_9ACTN|nr:hypothetical protein [Frankia nepalensis]MBL7498807.1 hypothetical protein [Frankia nepalensis]MBL7508612.1 hypothetical protein [Frankia nepalensis]MBL7517470.1 hypothetical protein [Frankia nepalensis]MBL7629716.1 hypothetical protein [Frankia nepalensis]